MEVDSLTRAYTYEGAVASNEVEEVSEWNVAFDASGLGAPGGCTQCSQRRRLA